MTIPGLNLAVPIVAAPMAGGPSTPALVLAAARAGSFGFLAGGYKPVESLASQIKEVRASDEGFGVNLFVPNPVPVDPEAYRAYAGVVHEEGERFGLDLRSIPLREDDDGWEEKIALLLADPVPVVSFTFGIPGRRVIGALRRAGSVTVQTVTSAAEAVLAAEAGVDALAVQGHEAGGHYGTLTPGTLPLPVGLVALVREVAATARLPVLGAGGIATPSAAAAVMAAGASAAIVGTFLLKTDESGASLTYKDALAARSGADTVVTRAFSGRPARAIRNLFVDRYDDVAPLGYPAIHHLTSPLRRAAAGAGDEDLINLWAGTGHALAPTGSAVEALQSLAADL